MNELADILLAPGRKGAVVTDCVELVDRHVAGRRGLRGLSLKAGLAMLKATRPDLLPCSIDGLMPEFVAALEPLFRRYLDSDSGDFAAFLREHADEAARLLIARADRRVAASTNPKVKANYERFRGMAEDEVKRAVPALGEVIAKYLKVAATSLAVHQA